LIGPASQEPEAVDGIQVIALPETEKRYERPGLWWRIIREIRRIKPGIAHFHDPELLLIAPFLRPAKVVYDCHEPYAETTLLRDWIPRSVRYPLSRLVAVLEPILARQTHAIIVTEETHAIPFRRGRQRLETVHNFPFVEDFLPRCSDGRTVIHVGVNSAPRGCTTIIEAIKLLAVQVPEVKLIIVGDFDPPCYEEKIRRSITGYGLEQNVLLLGRIPFADVPRLLAQADVGLVPWLGGGDFPTRVIPTKLFEYMSASVPIVASDLPTTRRFMDGLDCGFLVEPGSPEDLARSVEYLLSHPAEAERMGANGRRAVEERYNWRMESVKLLELYRELAQERTVAERPGV
jgi:glycosyltransferase involved in cell wall biosynthesis